MLTCHLHNFLGEMSYDVFLAQFLIKFFCFFILEFYEFFVYFV